MNKKDKERKKEERKTSYRQNGEKELQEKIDKFSYRIDWLEKSLYDNL